MQSYEWNVSEIKVIGYIIIQKTVFSDQNVVFLYSVTKKYFKNIFLLINNPVLSGNMFHQLENQRYCPKYI